MVRINPSEVNRADTGKFEKISGDYFVKSLIANSKGDFIDNIGQWISSDYDYIAIAYPTTTTETYTYKSGGSGGTTVATITVTYTDTSKTNLSSVEKS